MTTIESPATQSPTVSAPERGRQRSAALRGPGRAAASSIAGFLGALLVLNTYWALGGTWGVAWVLGCAGCTVPLALVWVQEAMIVAGIATVAARAGLWRPPLPQGLWRLGLWLMAASFAAVGAENMLGDNSLRNRLLFAPAALGLGALCVVADRRLPRPARAQTTGTAPGAPPPRWARRAAVLAALTPVPSALWRLSMALGLPVGVDETYRQTHYGFPGWGTYHVVWISALLVCLSCLTLGLVRPWGEMVPRWIPFIGGRPVRPLAAIVPAGAGAFALTVMWTTVFSDLGDIFDTFGLEGSERIVVGAFYAPLLLWGPLLAAVTVSYAKRRPVRRHPRVS